MIRKPLFPLLFLGGLLVCSPSFGQTDSEANQPDLGQVEQQILTQVNAFRQQMGKKPLKANPELTKAARYFAQYLADHDQFSHTADGSQPWDRAKKFGYDYCIVEENIAYEFSSAGFSAKQLADSLVKGWENSPGHRKNMLYGDVDETGIAVAHSSKSGKYYAVQEFGRPKSEAVKFSVANQTESDVRYTVDGKEYSLQPRYTRTHEVCTPPTLSLETPAKTTNNAGGKALHPQNGTHFVIRQGESGGIAIVKE